MCFRPRVLGVVEEQVLNTNDVSDMNLAENGENSCEKNHSSGRVYKKSVGISKSCGNNKGKEEDMTGICSLIIGGKLNNDAE